MKRFSVQKATIYVYVVEKIEQNGNYDRKSGSETGKLMNFMANQNGLQSLQKIWNELVFLFVI